MTKNKYKYFINQKEVKRSEFKENLAIVFQKVETCGFFGIGFPNYEKAERKIQQMQKSKIILVTSKGSFKIKKEA